MTRKKRKPWVIMILAALAAIALSLTYYGVQVVGSRESESLAAAESAAEGGNGLDGSADEASDSASTRSADARSAKEKKDKEAEAAKQEQEAPAFDSSEAEPEPEVLTIAGAVLDDAGQPVQGATVVAGAVNNSAADDEVAAAPAGRQTRTTDRLGTFEFSDLTEGEYDLTASKGEDYFPVTSRIRAGLANAELIMQRFRTIRVYGKVTDEFGAPLDEVQVRTLGTQTRVTSGGDGSYDTVTAPMKAGSPPVLEFRREGFEKTRRRIDEALGERQDEVQLDVQMEPDSDGPKVEVAGQVRGPLGEAVVGISVRLKSFKSRKGYFVRTYDSGEFSIPEVETGEGYTLSVDPSDEYEAYKSEVFGVGPQDEFFEIDLDAAKLASLSGTVTDLDGRPLSGFQLSLRGIGTSAQSTVPVRTDAAGRFRLEQLRAGEVRLESLSQPRLSASNIVLKPGVQKDVEIPLDWGAEWLLGQVVDDQGNPVPGAKIIVTWEERFGAVVSESRRDLRSDLGGYFTASNLGAEQYSLTVQAPGYQSFKGQHQLGRTEGELEVVLPRNSP